MERNILDFISSHLEKVVPLNREMNRAYWKYAIHGRPAEEKRWLEKRRDMTAIFSDRESYARILTYDEGGLTETQETARQLRLLRLAFAAHQMPPAAVERLSEEQDEIARLVKGFRVVVDGEEYTDDELSYALRHSDDSEERRELWEATHVLGDRIGPLMLRMVGLRNRAARELDYRDYYRMALDLQEMNEGILEAAIQDLLAGTEKPWLARKAELDAELAERFGIAAKKLRPWHYSEPIFPGAPRRAQVDFDKYYGRKSVTKLAEAFFKGIGIEMKDVLARGDFAPRDGKLPGSFCLQVDPAHDDVRVSTSVRWGVEGMTTLLRELGAAAYLKGLAHNLPYLVRRPAHALLVEAVSILMERQARDPDFLKLVVKANKSAITRLTDKIESERRLQMLLMARWIPVLVLFERALYENPGQDLNRIWWELVARILHVTPPDGRKGRHDWAAQRIFALRPVTAHDRMYGELAASQLDAAIREATGKPSLVGNEAAGPFLRERLFAPGAKRHWAQTLKDATGQHLKTRFFLDDRIR